MIMIMREKYEEEKKKKKKKKKKSVLSLLLSSMQLSSSSISSSSSLYEMDKKSLLRRVHNPGDGANRAKIPTNKKINFDKIKCP